jgi:hypothetical protein
MENLAGVLQAILGQNGENLRSERGILTVEPFLGRNTEDPVSWLAKFERARTANRWKKRKLIDIAGGLMKGEATAWFETTKENWKVIPRYDSAEEEQALNEGDNGTDNFTDDFKERFVMDQRKNDWHVQLLTLKQEDDTVKRYAAKFLKLIKRVDINDEDQKRRMFLFRLNPAYITFVQMGQHQTLNEMINAAKQVEIGFTLSTGKSITSNKKKNDATKELDVLTSQMQQLSLNYATLANAFMAQSENSNRSGRSNNRNFRGKNNHQRSSSRPPL